MINIDRYAYHSKLKKQDPREKLIFALLTIVVCLWADNIYISVLVIIIMAWVTLQKGGLPLNIYLKLMLLPMSFLTLGVVTIAFEVSHDPEIFIVQIFLLNNYMGLTKMGVVTAANLFLKALGAVSCMYYLSLNTPMVDLMIALNQLKCPKLFVEMMALVYRFIFILLKTTEDIYTAQNSRLGYLSLSSAYQSMGKLISILFIKAYKHTDMLYTALEARGYDGEMNVMNESFNKGNKGYIIPLIVNGILVMAALYIKRDVGG